MAELKNLLNVHCRVDHLLVIGCLADLQAALERVGGPEGLTIVGGASNLIPLDYLPGVTCEIAL
ncbi:MAG: UDP-N-acetylmuramate dehydrogenase, partial [Proteobacteria bacterium]|nr:UDP-N-acetylmuramate dehydrogenase [Pseudomonadota bacterium]